MGTLLNIALFAVSALLSYLILVYFKLKVVNVQQILVVLILVILLTYNKVSEQKGLSKISRMGMMTLGSLFVQLLVISSGGFFSPFLILIHLYTLGASFLINLTSATTFLIFTITLIVIYSLTNPQYHQLFLGDIGSVLLYLATFVVVVPLSAMVSKQYHLKESLFNLVSKKFNVIQSQQEILYMGLNELVVITDSDLKILSANDAIKNMYNLTDSELIHKTLLELLDLKDATGKKIDQTDLQVQSVLLDRASRIVNGYYLYPPKGSLANKIVIQIRPVISQENSINQLMFILSEDQKQSHVSHQELNEAINRQQGVKEQILNKLIATGRNHDVIALFEVFSNMERDIFLAAEIEDHGIKPNNTLLDLAFYLKKLVKEKMAFAAVQNVDLSFVLPESEAAEKVRLQLLEENVARNSIPVSSFYIPIDEKWFKVMGSELVDLSIILASSSSGRKVKVEISHTKTGINLLFICTIPSLTQEDLRQIFTKYYPTLQNKLTVQIYSGLEGFIAKEISTRLGIPLDVSFSKDGTEVYFRVVFTTTKV
jgi:PAS domain-containing protein